MAVALFAALSVTAYQCDSEARQQADALKARLANGKSLPAMRSALASRGMRYSLVSDAQCRQLAVDNPGTCLGGPILMSDHWLDCKACRIVQGGHIEVDVRFDKAEQAASYNVILTPSSAWTPIRSKLSSLLSK
jgi:hypothetical protein